MSVMFTVVRETRLDPRFPLSRRELAELGAVIMETLDLEGEVIVKLVNDAGIARLNREFMGCTGPTNVLSFPAADDGSVDGAEDSPLLGELALSVETLTREAHLYGQPPTAHLTRLLAHGILHLAGFDHGETMHELTDRAVDRVLLEDPS